MHWPATKLTALASSRWVSGRPACAAQPDAILIPKVESAEMVHELESLMDATRGWRAAVAGSPRWAALAVGLLGLASTACWLPTMQVDDLAYHLGLPTQLLMYGEYRPDPVHQVWSYAPWAGDALQGFAAVLAGEHARGGLNALWLAVAAGGVWSASAGIGYLAWNWLTMGQVLCVPMIVGGLFLIWLAYNRAPAPPAAAA